MNVLLGTQYFYPSSNGGTELYVHELANNLIALGHKVAIIKIGKEEDYFYENYKVHVLPKGNFHSEIGPVEIQILEKFERIIKDFNPQIFHLNTLHEHMNGYFIIKAKNLGIKCVFTSHLAINTCPKGDLMLMGKTICDGFLSSTRCLECILYSNNKKYYSLSKLINTANKYFPIISNYSPAIRSISAIKTQLRLLNRYIDLIIVQSNWQKEVFEINNFDSQKIKTIRLGLPLKFIKNKKGIKSENKSIGFIARYSQDKGLDILLDAISLVGTKLDIHLCISLNKMEIIELKEKLSIIKNIHTIYLHLNANKEKIIKILDLIDTLIIPSTVIETGPYVLLEALSRKKPVIGSNIGGIAELIIPNKNGYLFEVGNHVMLAFYLNKFFSLSNVDKFDDIKYFEVKSSKKYAEEMQYAYKKILNNAKN